LISHPHGQGRAEVPAFDVKPDVIEAARGINPLYVKNFRWRTIEVHHQCIRFHNQDTMVFRSY
jgi:hypothetical protein